MIYVTEVGPVRLGLFECWVVLLLDDERVTPHVSPSRFNARRWAAADLRDRGVKKVRCAPGLADYGSSRGWKVEPPTPRHTLVAASAVISLENERVLGPAAFSPLLEGLLEACALFRRAEPWKRADFADQPVRITSGSDSRIAAITGNVDAPPGVVLFPDLDRYERAMSKQPDRSSLGDAVVVALMRSRSRTAQLIEAATGQRFNLLLRRRRREREGVFTEEDLTWARLAMRTLAGADKVSMQGKESPQVLDERA